MAAASATTTTSNPDKEFLNSFITLLSHSYLGTPLTTAFITEIDSTPPPYPSDSVSSARLKAHFTLGITAAAKSNILLTQADHFTAAALWEPPDFCGVPPSQARRNPGPILQQWRDTARALKATHLIMPETGPRSWDTPAAPSQSSGGPSEDPYPADFNKDVDAETRPFYHLAILARDPRVEPERADQAVKAVMEPFLAKARAEQTPVWLEATSQKSRAEFEAFGFRVCEEVVIGKGRVDEKGWPKEGGAGVKCWGMIWDE